MRKIETIMLFAAMLTSACGGVRHAGRGDLVREVTFEGNGGAVSGHGDYTLRSQMETTAVGPRMLRWPFSMMAAPAWLDDDALARDVMRLEVYYAQHGWFNARVLGFDARRVKLASAGRAGVIDLVGMVDPGARSFVDRLLVTGVDDFTAAQTAQFNEMWRHVDVSLGDPFILADSQITRASITAQLQDLSFAYATVDLAVHATPAERSVALTYQVDHGIPARFGEVRITGNEDVADRDILATMDFSAGDPYSTSAIATSINGLFDLGTFSVVSVKPDLSNPDNPIVDVDVALSESQFHRLRLGTGLSWDASTLSPHIVAQYRRVNLFNRLVKLQPSGLLGYALEATEGSVVGGGMPIYDADIGLTAPRVGHPDITIFVEGGVEQKLQNGQFAYRRPEVGVGLSFDASDWVVQKHGFPVQTKALVSLGVNAEIFDYLDLTDEAVVAAQTIFGSGFKDPYRLVMMDLNMSIDTRDDPVSARTGALYRTILSKSLASIADDFDFYKAVLEVRGYRPVSRVYDAIGTPLSVAGRVRVSGLYAVDGSALPYPERLFMGGATDHRGYRLNQVGAYDCLCSYDSNGDVTQRYLPKGGVVSGLASGELRYDWRYALSFAGFSDVGVLVDDWSELSLASMRIGAGVGVRYASFVGPIRFDLSVRPLMPEDAGPTSVVGCETDADALPRAYDLMSQSVANRFSAFDRTVPVVTNIFLSIGSAF